MWAILIAISIMSICRKPITDYPSLLILSIMARVIAHPTRRIQKALYLFRLSELSRSKKLIWNGDLDSSSYTSVRLITNIAFKKLYK